MRPAYYPYLILVEYSTPFLLNLISMYAFARVLRSQLQLDRHLSSPTLVLYLLAWLSTMLLSVPYLVYMVATWTSTGATQNAQWIFWLGLPMHAVSMAIPVAVLFLSVNRILFLGITPVHYTETNQKRVLYTAWACSFIVVGANAVNFLLYSIPSTLDTTCLTFVCLTKASWNFYSANKAVFGLANTLVGVVLLVRVWKMRRTTVIIVQAAESTSHTGGGGLHEKGHNANLIAVVAVAAELWLNFIPQFIVIVMGVVSDSSTVSSYYYKR